MGMPDEQSLFCSGCSVFNIQFGDCIIIDGDAYCSDCIERKGLIKDFDKLKKKLRKK